MPRFSRNLTDPRVIILKGGLFLVAGLLASGILAADILNHAAGWRALAMHGLAVWCFCRAYYFAFYVIQHYVDASYRFAGLGSAVRWLAKRRMRD